MYIEGKNAVIQALANNTTILKLYVDKNIQSRKDDIVQTAIQNKVRVEFLPKPILDKKSKTQHHQGYIAETVDFVYSGIEDMLAFASEKQEDPFIVLLDGIEDPHNFGAIIRSCECAGVHGIIIPKNRACQVNETVIHISTGAITNMKIAKVTNLKDAIAQLQENNIWVYAAELGGTDLYQKKLQGPIGIVIGSEGEGIKQTIQSKCDGVLTLPMHGKVNSLNASVACGVVVFEVLRQRGHLS